jgi:Ca2+-binding RTX toxin-like protein
VAEANNMLGSIAARRCLAAATIAATMFATQAQAPAGAAPGDDFPISYSPTSGPEGTIISVSGSGCTPPAGGGTASVRIFLVDAAAASIVLGSGSADAAGNFAFDVTAESEFLPQLPPFDYTGRGSAECTEFQPPPDFGFDKFFSAFDFEVTLPSARPPSTGSLTLSTTAPLAGDSVTVTAPQRTDFDETGNGFIPGQDVKIVMYPGAVQLGTATATDQTNALSTSVAIPPGTAPGAYTLVAFGDYMTVSPSFTALSARFTVPGCEGLAATIQGAGVINGTEGDDVILGSAGNDTINGLGGNDTICALRGNDTITDGDGDDVVVGGAGRDTFVQGAAANGADELRGDTGTDTVTYAARTAAVTVTLAGGADDGALAEGDDVSDVEGATGGSGADTLTGSAANNVLVGGSGRDSLEGGLGNDMLSGGANNDTLDVSDGIEGNDTANGGSGSGDTADADPGDAVINVP